MARKAPRGAQRACEHKLMKAEGLRARAETFDVMTPLRSTTAVVEVSGILNARSGSWLDVTTGRDVAGTGIQGTASTRCWTTPTVRRH
jgi:hypothetical protein